MCLTDRHVYYDGGCRVCSREIALYWSLRGAERFEGVDVSAPGAELVPVLTPSAAQARMRVGTPDGALFQGAAAFAAIWRMMPGFRWPGRLAATPPLGVLAEASSRLFLFGR